MVCAWGEARPRAGAKGSVGRKDTGGGISPAAGLAHGGTAALADGVGLGGEAEEVEVLAHALLEGGGLDEAADGIGLVVAAHLGAPVVHGAEVVGGEVGAAQAERLVEGGDVRRHAAGATAGAFHGGPQRTPSVARTLTEPKLFSSRGTDWPGFQERKSASVLGSSG